MPKRPGVAPDQPDAVLGRHGDWPDLETVFREHPDPGYAGRTEWNAANSDATIDFAEPHDGVFFGSGGARGLTRQMAHKHHRPYVGVPIERANLDPVASAALIVAGLPKDPGRLRINIAGHGITRMRGVSQATINIYVTETLAVVISRLERQGQAIALIMSGGQTGFDEAGIIAGRALGIATMVTAPRGWRFRSADGVDVADRETFMSRFSSASDD